MAIITTVILDYFKGWRHFIRSFKDWFDFMFVIIEPNDLTIPKNQKIYQEFQKEWHDMVFYRLGKWGTYPTDNDEIMLGHYRKVIGLIDKIRRI